MISLSQIIKDALDFINYQLEEDYDKYHIEQHLKWANHHEVMDNVMPEIVKFWGVDEEKVILILSCHHDQENFAYEFASFSELNEKLRFSRYYLNPFITYAIPIVEGQVRSFKLFDEHDMEIKKAHHHSGFRDYYDQLKIQWD